MEVFRISQDLVVAFRLFHSSLRHKSVLVIAIILISTTGINSSTNNNHNSTTCPFSKIIQDIFKIHNKTSDAGIFLKNSEEAKIFVNSIANTSNEDINRSNDEIVNGIIASINRIKNNITDNHTVTRMDDAIIINEPTKESNESKKNTPEVEEIVNTYILKNDVKVNSNEIKQGNGEENEDQKKVESREEPAKKTYVEILTIEPNNTNSNTSQNNILEVLKQLMPIFNNSTMKELHNITLIETNYNKNHTFSSTKNISTIVVTYCDKENLTKANVNFDSSETDLKQASNDNDDYYFENPKEADDYDDLQSDANLTVEEKRSILEATEYGMQKMEELYSVIEPKLYNMGLWLEDANPARYVAAFSAPNEQSERFARYGHATLETARRLQQIISDGNGNEGQEGRMEEATFPGANALRQTQLLKQCPLKGAPKCPPASKRYRTHDGTCNNINRPRWGSTMTPVQRFISPSYSDGLQASRRSVFGSHLPSAREISSFIHEDQYVENPGITHLLMQWGQFLDHDVTSSSQSRGFNGSVPRCCKDGGKDFVSKELMHPECMPIAVPASDPFYGPRGVRCLDFVRSSPAPREDCSLGWREQMNQVSAYIDASPLYASSAKQSDKLRLFRNGMLQYGRVQQRRPLLPPERKDELCRGGAVSTDCFKSGDGRVNEHPGLVAAHIVWLRQHNRMAQELAHLNPNWSDEKIYQETRKIVGAMVQHITYKEFLPIVLGEDVMHLFDLEPQQKGYYRGYDPKVNPSPASSFSSAAFRFGHSLVQPSMVRYDRFHRPVNNNVSLHDELTNPSNIWSMGAVDRLLLGMINQPIQSRDEFITEELTNHLFQTPSFTFGMDLAAINIQRGRDHGVPPYTTWREPCGLSAIEEFEDLNRVMPRRIVRKLKALYRSVADIDLYTGGLAERPVVGGLVGPTFACIIAQQFSNLRKGDRFWYENGGADSSFTPAQLQQIRRISMAQVLCRTLDTIDNIQLFAFLSPNPDNQRISCQNGVLNNFDLSPWVEITSDFNNDIRKSDIPDALSAAHRPFRPTTTVKPKLTTIKTQNLSGAAANNQKKPEILNFTNDKLTPTDINEDTIKTDIQNTATIDDKLDFKSKSKRHDDYDTDRNNFKYDFSDSKKQYNDDYDDDDNVQTVQAVVINNSGHKRPSDNYYNYNQHSYNHKPNNQNSRPSIRPDNRPSRPDNRPDKRPVITVTENIDKYTYLINYVPKPTEPWRQTTRRAPETDRDVIKVTYQNYDHTYNRPKRPYYYDNKRHENNDNRHEDYDDRHEGYDTENSNDRSGVTDTEGDNIQFSARSKSNDDPMTVDNNRPENIVSTTDSPKLVTFSYLGTYKGDVTNDKLTSFILNDSDKLTESNNKNVRLETISKDFPTLNTDIKQDLTTERKDISIDKSDGLTNVDKTEKFSTFFLYETATKPYRQRPTRFNDNDLAPPFDNSKYYYVQNILNRYPQKNMTAIKKPDNDSKKMTDDFKKDVIKENYNNPGVQLEGENIQERSSLEKLAFLEEVEKSAISGASRKKLKKPGSAKIPTVAFDVIPSENSPTQWIVYEENEDLTKEQLRRMPSVKADPHALKEIPRPMNFTSLRKRRPGTV